MSCSAVEQEGLQYQNILKVKLTQDKGILIVLIWKDTIDMFFFPFRTFLLMIGLAVFVGIISFHLGPDRSEATGGAEDFTFLKSADEFWCLFLVDKLCFQLILPPPE